MVVNLRVWRLWIACFYNLGGLISNTMKIDIIKSLQNLDLYVYFCKPVFYYYLISFNEAKLFQLTTESSLTVVSY